MLSGPTPGPGTPDSSGSGGHSRGRAAGAIAGARGEAEGDGRGLTGRDGRPGVGASLLGGRTQRGSMISKTTKPARNASSAMAIRRLSGIGSTCGAFD